MEFIDYDVASDQIALKISVREAEMLLRALEFVVQLNDPDFLLPHLADDEERQRQLVERARQLQGKVAGDRVTLGGADFCDMGMMLRSLMVARQVSVPGVADEEFAVFERTMFDIFYDQVAGRRPPKTARK